MRVITVPFQPFDHSVVGQDTKIKIDIGPLAGIVGEPAQVDDDPHPPVSVQVERP